MSLVLPPKVRYLIVCDDVVQDPRWPKKPVVVGPIGRVIAAPSGPTPLPKMTVFATLTGGRGTGLAQVRCVDEMTGRQAFETSPQLLSFIGRDPSGLHGFVHRATNIEFPDPSFYAVELVYEDDVIGTWTLQVR